MLAACFMMVSCLAYSCTLKTEVTHSFKTLVDVQWTIQHYLPEVRTFHDLYGAHLNCSFQGLLFVTALPSFPSFLLIITFYTEHVDVHLILIPFHRAGLQPFLSPFQLVMYRCIWIWCNCSSAGTCGLTYDLFSFLLFLFFPPIMHRCTCSQHTAQSWHTKTDLPFPFSSQCTDAPMTGTLPNLCYPDDRHSFLTFIFLSFLCMLMMYKCTCVW